MTRSSGPATTTAQCEAVLDEIGRAVVGKRRALNLILTTMLARGHILIAENAGSNYSLLHVLVLATLHHLNNWFAVKEIKLYGDGEFLEISFLIIENKFSNAGYHSKFKTKIGEIFSLLLANKIKKYPINTERK